MPLSEGECMFAIARKHGSLYTLVNNAQRVMFIICETAGKRKKKKKKKTHGQDIIEGLPSETH